MSRKGKKKQKLRHRSLTKSEAKNRQKWIKTREKPARVAKVRDVNVEESTHPGAGGAIGETGSGSTGFSGALNDPAIYLALNTLGPAICHKP